ncbi:hypothetical protein PWT90_03652 [Aphanocladium album]|nr:hypothetical protein PWT90_03652 [Aphanocladium album]
MQVLPRGSAERAAIENHRPDPGETIDASRHEDPDPRGSDGLRVAQSTWRHPAQGRPRADGEKEDHAGDDAAGHACRNGQHIFSCAPASGSRLPRPWTADSLTWASAAPAPVVESWRGLSRTPRSGR